MLTEIEVLADNIATLLWESLLARCPELKELIAHRIAAQAQEKYAYLWNHPETISRIVNAKIEELLATTFKPALDEIAQAKAKEKVAQRARQNKIEPETLPGMEGE